MDIVVTPGLDPAHDVLHYGRQALDAIFAPKSVAVIGATETPGSVGRTIVWNLLSMIVNRRWLSCCGERRLSALILSLRLLIPMD